MTTNSASYCPLSDDRVAYWDDVMVLSNPSRVLYGDRLHTGWGYQRARLTVRQAIDEAVQRVGKGCHYDVLYSDIASEEMVTVTFWVNAQQCLDDYMGDNIAAVVQASRAKVRIDYDHIPF